MSKKEPKKQKPISMEEALGHPYPQLPKSPTPVDAIYPKESFPGVALPDAPPPPQTQDEVVGQAMSDLSAETQMLGTPEEPRQIHPRVRPQEIQIPSPQTKSSTTNDQYPTKTMSGTMSSPPKKEKPIIPVSNTEPPPATGNSTQESLGLPRKKLIVNTDAGMVSNPGTAVIACIVRDELGNFVDRCVKGVGHTTNNVAEYLGVIEALRIARSLKATDIEIRSDSELIVKQLSGDYKVKDQRLRGLYDKVKSLSATLIKEGVTDINIIHVPREHNEEADALAGLAVRPDSKKATPTPIDDDLLRLISFIDSGEYSETWVTMHISSISSFPRVLPSPTMWAVPSRINMGAIVYKLVLEPGFVENMWPHLSLVLGSCRDNISWCAAVLTTAALFEAIKLLPFAIADEDS